MAAWGVMPAACLANWLGASDTAGRDRALPPLSLVVRSTPARRRRRRRLALALGRQEHSGAGDASIKHAAPSTHQEATHTHPQTMLLQRHCGELVDSRSLGQMLDLLKSEDVYERLFARDALYLQIDAKVGKDHGVDPPAPAWW